MRVLTGRLRMARRDSGILQKRYLRKTRRHRMEGAQADSLVNQVALFAPHKN